MKKQYRRLRVCPKHLTTYTLVLNVSLFVVWKSIDNYGNFDIMFLI